VSVHIIDEVKKQDLIEEQKQKIERWDEEIAEQKQKIKRMEEEIMMNEGIARLQCNKAPYSTRCFVTNG